MRAHNQACEIFGFLRWAQGTKTTSFLFVDGVLLFYNICLPGDRVISNQKQDIR